MKAKFLFLVFFLSVSFTYAQKPNKEKDTIFKKAVLEKTEIDLLMSYYTQEGNHSAVGGGIGTEQLSDITPTIVVSVPVNDDDVITIDAGISAYTSASSSNLNPFDASGASSGDSSVPMPLGSPWIASSGASRKDALGTIVISYNHSSDDRNKITNIHSSFGLEYDYASVGFGAGFTKLFNKKNTELSFNTSVYLDKWRALYPTELEEFAQYGTNFQSQGYFNNVTVFDQTGSANTDYNPEKFTFFDKENRNTFALTFSFSQILSKKLQGSLFFDAIYQQGLLSTPYHRIYFSDRNNFFIGQNISNINQYTNSVNNSVFQLADDKERLPNSRLKLPVGLRINYFLNEYLTLRTYYRFYSDDWEISSNTMSLELPIKVTRAFTVNPSYRYYNQTQTKYFAPYEQHLSTSEFYTSDYDLSEFNSNQYSLGLRYTDIFTKYKVFKKFGFKTIDLKYSYYQRSDGLDAFIISSGLKFIMD